VKKIGIDHNLLPYPKRLLVQDAIFVWQLNQQARMQALQIRLQAAKIDVDAKQEQENQIRIMQLEAGFSRATCLAITTGAKTLDEQRVRAGYKTIRVKEKNELY
jgi:hypothetical protein